MALEKILSTQRDENRDMRIKSYSYGLGAISYTFLGSLCSFSELGEMSLLVPITGSVISGFSSKMCYDLRESAKEIYNNKNSQSINSKEVDAEQLYSDNILYSKIYHSFQDYFLVSKSLLYSSLTATVFLYLSPI